MLFLISIGFISHQLSHLYCISYLSLFINFFLCVLQIWSIYKYCIGDLLWPLPHYQFTSQPTLIIWEIIIENIINNFYPNSPWPFCVKWLLTQSLHFWNSLVFDSNINVHSFVHKIILCYGPGTVASSWWGNNEQNELFSLKKLKGKERDKKYIYI